MEAIVDYTAAYNGDEFRFLFCCFDFVPLYVWWGRGAWLSLVLCAFHAVIPRYVGVRAVPLPAIEQRFAVGADNDTELIEIVGGISAESFWLGDNHDTAMAGDSGLPGLKGLAKDTQPRASLFVIKREMRCAPDIVIVGRLPMPNVIDV